MKITTEMLDPFPGIDRNELSKYRHLFKEGDRITVCDGPHSGRSGKLLVINAHKGHVVRLDSGHEVEYSDRELEPEGFSRHATSAKSLDRVQKALDPLPFDDDPVVKSQKAFSHAARESFRPLIKTVAVLNRALEAGTVSDRDRVLIKMAFENIETCRVNVDPLDFFGETEEHNARTLRIMAEKYAGTSAGETLTKVALRPDKDHEFSVGQMVKNKASGKKGKITRLDYGFADVAHEDGTKGVTTCDLLEAA